MKRDGNQKYRFNNSSIHIMKLLLLISVCILICFSSSGQDEQAQKTLDEKVSKFLKEHKGKWRDLNVPYEDGQVLHDIIVKNKYTSALEIGTSTGHSAIWIAWALSKTGGKLITIEIDKERI